MNARPRTPSARSNQNQTVPFIICKTFEFESGHILSQHPGKCRFPHGHSRRLEVVVSSETLDANGMVCDFQVIKRLSQELLDRWDHALCLNTEDPNFAFYQQAYGPQVVSFVRTEPTSEIMAKTIFDELKRKLAAAEKDPATTGTILRGLRLERVRLTETSSSWAEYSE
jgi:6-pyruvoyltetrahydropterin/6-carboxytetrahydropterin synthase